MVPVLDRFRALLRHDAVRNGRLAIRRRWGVARGHGLTCSPRAGWPPGLAELSYHPGQGHQCNFVRDWSAPAGHDGNGHHPGDENQGSGYGITTVTEVATAVIAAIDQNCPVAPHAALAGTFA